MRARLESGEKPAMEFLESALRSALLKDGAHLLEDLLNDPLYKGQEQDARPGEKCYRDRAKTVETLFGEGTLQCSEDFGTLLRREAFARGFASAQKTVYLGDGAAWVWEVARINFPQAIWILDFYHAGEHLSMLAEALYCADAPRVQSQAKIWRAMLLEDRLQEVLSQARFAVRDLRQLTARAVGQLGERLVGMEARITAYRNLRLTDSRAHDLVIRATDCRAITPSQIPEVLAQWRNSAHAEFAPRNGWSLWNACTEAFKSVNPHTAIARCEALHGLFDGAAGVALAS